MGFLYMFELLRKVARKLIYFKLIYFSKCKKIDKSNKDVVVTLTSYPQRFDILYLSLKSIFNQTVMPNEVVLYLDKKESKYLPQNIYQFTNFGLKIIAVPKNIKPHKKYFYAFTEYPNSIIITVDDDCIYNKNLIKELLKTSNKHPNSVIAARARKIKFSNNRFLQYNEWPIEKKREYTSKWLLPTGVGGVLYPPNIFNVDDLWIKANELIDNIEITTCRKNVDKFRIDLNSNMMSGLYIENVNKNGNSEQWTRLVKIFDLDKYIK